MATAAATIAIIRRAQYRPEQFLFRAAGQAADLPGKHGGGQAVSGWPQPGLGEFPSLKERLGEGRPLTWPVRQANLIAVALTANS